MKLKVGDRVVVYDCANRLIATVEGIGSYGKLAVKTIAGDPIFWVHSKQCRKIVKRKRKFRSGDKIWVQGVMEAPLPDGFTAAIFLNPNIKSPLSVSGVHMSTIKHVKKKKETK